MADDLGRIAAHFESASQPVWLWDAERHRLVWANAAGRAFWGAETLFDLADRVFPADAPDVGAMAEAGRTPNGRLTPPRGRVRATLEIAATRLPEIPHGRLVRLLSHEADGLPPSSKLRGELFMGAPMGLALATADGVVIDSNRAWRGFTGAAAERLDALFGVAEATRFLHFCVVAGRAQAVATLAGRRLRVNGRRIRQAAGQPPLVYVSAEDVTIAHALETLLTRRAGATPEAARPAPAAAPNDADLAARLADAERKSQAKSDFIAKLSHEMRNPLNAIIGFSEIMQHHTFGPLGDARYEIYTSDIRTSAHHLLSLVNDLLDLARIESGKIKLEFDGVALPSLIEECVRLLRPQAEASGVHVQVMAPANLPPVVADSRSLKQILLNLVSNAVKFTGENGTVRVSAEMSGDGGIVISVTDTGIGMSHGEIQLALEPYGQVDGPMQKNRKGTGLGLPVAKALAEANKAVFRIESEPQRGTQVQVMFPPTRVLAG